MLNQMGIGTEDQVENVTTSVSGEGNKLFKAIGNNELTESKGRGVQPTQCLPADVWSIKVTQDDDKMPQAENGIKKDNQLGIIQEISMRGNINKTKQDRSTNSDQDTDNLKIRGRVKKGGG